jgi:hypothetical protein
MLLLLDTTDRWQQPVTVEIAVRADTLEVRHQGRLRGVADRAELGEWLRRPEGAYAHDELTWLAVGSQVALTIEDSVPAWFLDPHAVTTLRVQL